MRCYITKYIVNLGGGCILHSQNAFMSKNTTSFGSQLKIPSPLKAEHSNILISKAMIWRYLVNHNLIN